MNDYAGTSVFPALIPLIDDSDPPDASNFDPTGEALADRTVWLHDLAIQAINGVTGGVYAPSAPIVIGGQGLICPDGAQWELDGNLYLDGTGAFTPTITLDGAGAHLVAQGGAVVDIDSGSLFQIHVGGSGQIFGALSIGSAASLNVAGAEAHSGTSTTTHASGSTDTYSAGSTLTLAVGSDCKISDATAPQYTTPLTRVLAQPLVFSTMPNAGWGLLGPDSVTDGMGGQQLSIALTQLVNGASITALLMRMVWSSGHVAPTTAATMQLRKVLLTTGAATLIQSFTIVTTGSPPSTFLIFNLPTPEVVDTDLYAYSLQLNAENGGSAQAIVWYPPRVSFTNIQYLGQR
jgi:hypothetical protein